jgi:hypothetical protein
LLHGPGRGGFLSKFGDQLGATLLPLSKSACKFFLGHECSDVELAIGAPIPFFLNQGRISRDDHDAGAIHAPQGYQYCKLAVNTATGSVSGHAQFNATLQNDRQQFAYLMHVNKDIPALGGGDAGQSTKFNVYYEAFKYGILPAPPRCMKDGAVFGCGEGFATNDCVAFQTGGKVSINDVRPE